MGYSLKDLENAGKTIHDTLEENSRRKGEEIANRIVGKFTGQNASAQKKEGGFFSSLFGTIFIIWLITLFFSNSSSKPSVQQSNTAPISEVESNTNHGQTASNDEIQCSPSECASLAQKYYFGHDYTTGLDVQKDIELAAKLYKKACDGGIGASCANLGVIYEIGKDGYQQDKPLALEYYRQGCDYGNSQGCKNYAELYQGMNTNTSYVQNIEGGQGTTASGLRHYTIQCKNGTKHEIMEEPYEGSIRWHIFDPNIDKSFPEYNNLGIESFAEEFCKQN